MPPVELWQDPIISELYTMTITLCNAITFHFAVEEHVWAAIQDLMEAAVVDCSVRGVHPLPLLQAPISDVMSREWASQVLYHGHQLIDMTPACGCVVRNVPA